jgi:hypothetical protein
LNGPKYSSLKGAGINDPMDQKNIKTFYGYFMVLKTCCYDEKE